MVSFKFATIALIVAAFAENALARPQLSDNKPALHRRQVQGILQTAHDGAKNLNNVKPERLHNTIPLPEPVHPHPGHEDLVAEANGHQRNAVAAHEAGRHADRFKHQSDYHDTTSQLHKEISKDFRSDSQQHKVHQGKYMNNRAAAAAALGASEHIQGNRADARRNYGMASQMHGLSTAIKEEERTPLGELKNH